MRHNQGVQVQRIATRHGSKDAVCTERERRSKDDDCSQLEVASSGGCWQVLDQVLSVEVIAAGAVGVKPIGAHGAIREQYLVEERLARRSHRVRQGLNAQKRRQYGLIDRSGPAGEENAP